MGGDGRSWKVVPEVLRSGITKVFRVHPLENMNVCSMWCRDIEDVEIFHCKSRTCDLLMTLEQRSRDHRSEEGSSSGEQECLY